MKSIHYEHGELPVALIHDGVAKAYAKADAERMEWLNRKIAAEPKPVKYVYRRTHVKTAPGDHCSICGRKYGPCIEAVPDETPDAP